MERGARPGLASIPSRHDFRMAQVFDPELVVIIIEAATMAPLRASVAFACFPLPSLPIIRPGQR